MNENSAHPYSIDSQQSLERAMDLFDLLLEAEDPTAVLSAEPDANVRFEAERLWRHHLLATDQKFLDSPAAFEVTSVFEPGQLLLARFEIARLLGSGGMGEVYLAYDQLLGEQVAIKTIPRMLASSEWIRFQFIAEVKNARRVTHDNVCRIYDLFEDGEIPFFAMEYVDGKTLSQLISDGDISRKTALEITLQLASALDTAHRNGVVHGDFKPGNVLVVKSEPRRAVVMDFGLARALRPGGLPVSPRESVAAGTLGYMAPELADGSPTSVASDVFAFGKVAEMLVPGEKLWSDCTRPEPKDRLSSLTPVIKHLRKDKTRRYWLGGFILTTASVASYVVSHSNSTLRLPEGARVLINGFSAAASDVSLARLTRGLFFTGVSQSPRIRTLADEDVMPVLSRLSAGATLPASGLLLERLLENLRAGFWIEGEIKKIGERLSLVLRLFQAGHESAMAQAYFRDLPSVAIASTEGARWIRQTAGESEASLKLDSPAANEYTSAVPEALSEYYSAMNYYAVADMEQAIPPLRKAIALDPNFAQAHCMLAQCTASFWRLEESFAEASQAFQLARHLPERERTRIETVYYIAQDDPIQMVDCARRNLDLDPQEPRLLRTLARNLARAGRPVEGVRYLKQAVEFLPDSPLMRLELIEVLCEANRSEEALGYFEQRPDLAESVPVIYEGQVYALLGLERYQEALAASARVEEDMPRLSIAAQVLAGRLDISESDLLAQLARVELNGSVVDRFETRMFLAGLYALTDRAAVAETYLREALNFPAVPARCRYLEEAAFWAARIGDSSLLTQIDALVRQNLERWPTPRAKSALSYLTGLLAICSGDTDAATSNLLAACGFSWSVWPLFELAEVYLKHGKYNLSDNYWEKFNAKRGIILAYFFPGVLPLSWLRRADCARGLGRKDIAQELAQKIVALWQQSNPHLEIVKSARSLLS